MQGGVGRACDATQRYYTLIPIAPDSLIPRVLSSTRSPFLPPRPSFPGYSHRLSYLPLSLFLPATRSFGDAAALSNSRCNIQRLLAVVCGGGSAIATKKRAPRGRSLRPSNWRRCPSTVARMIVLSFVVRPFPAVFHPHSSLSLSLSPRIVSFSLRLPYVFIISFSFSLFSFTTSSSSFLSSDRIGHRPLAIEALMQPSRRWFIANRERVTDFSSLLIARPRFCFESYLRK